MKSPVSRRNFLQNTAILAAGMPFASHLSFYKNLFNAPLKSPLGKPLKPFDFGSVTLTNGIFKDQFERIFDFYTGIDNDSLLKPMRAAAGMPAPGRDMGGWYDLGDFAPGHCFGQILAALSRFYAITKNENIKEKVHQLTEGFNQTICVMDGPFFKNNRFPAYTFDKQVQGLTEAFSYADAGNALDVLNRALEQVHPYLPEKALTRAEMRARPHKDISFTYDESYTLPENLFVAYTLSNDKLYKKLAKRYLLNDSYFVPLSEGKPAFVNKHAYSHVNALSSAAKAYEILKDPMYYKAIVNAWEMIMQTQQFASGGWGPNETFVEPGKGLLGKSINTTENHFETPCGSYAHCKLGRYLIGFTSDSQYGDNMERVIYNGSLGVLDPSSNGSAFYYNSGYQPFATKKKTGPWPCCGGTLPLVVADYVRDIYFHDADVLYVNLYINSQLNWKRNNDSIAFEQKTGYPFQPGSQFKIKLNQPKSFTIYFRIPSWTNSKTVSIKINNENHPFNGQAGTYYPIKRKWENEDEININFDLTTYQLPIDPQHPNLVAFMQGPLMLVNINREMTPASDKQSASVDKSNFTPYFQIRDEVYTTYFNI